MLLSVFTWPRVVSNLLWRDMCTHEQCTAAYRAFVVTQDDTINVLLETSPADDMVAWQELNSTFGRIVSFSLSILDIANGAFAIFRRQLVGWR